MKDPEATRALLLQEAFLTAELAGDDTEITAHAIGKILAQLAGENIEAVMYTSTKREGGYNIGVLVDRFWDKLRIVGISKLYVEHLAYGQYDRILLEYVSKIDSDGRLHWEQNHSGAEIWQPLSPPWFPE